MENLSRVLGRYSEMNKSKLHFFITTLISFAATLVVLSSTLHSPALGQGRVHSIFFEQTDYELNVYKIHGKEPGKTLLLIGGIQGDEPGGFLSADLYADLSLAKGNLIVVPRANFQSILLKRRKVNEDMNRKFAEDQKINYETKIVTILKKLIAESDGLLNLHDGSGFYSEKWQGPDRNPLKYGQSIIADSERYENEDTGHVIELGGMARTVAEKINKSIENQAHHFHFNNHNTNQKSSLHKEQRKSATYYALYTCGIPAFGIETSKTLPIDIKVRYHNLAINAFMEVFGIVPETPGIYLEKPYLRSVVISVNDSMPIVLEDGHVFNINSGDTITVLHVEGNYERGLSADILGYGSLNDMRKPVRVISPTRIIVRKDYYPCGSIDIALNGSREVISGIPSASESFSVDNALFFFKVKINGRERIFGNLESVPLIKGDMLEIVDVVSNYFDPLDLIVNFKGFVGNIENNTGEDRGYVINTSRDLWKRYSKNNDGRIYDLIATKNDKTVGRLSVELEEPEVKYIVVQTEEGIMKCFRPGDTISARMEYPIKLIDINTNIDNNSGVKAFLVRDGYAEKDIKINEDIFADLKKNKAGKYQLDCRIDIRRDHITLGSVFLTF
ncbi:MAG: hypothetical protein JXL81_08570 [Deltaproteobacteria bacterium]|nr:hypothetical protein [Deltaproteobacteria bacterium]